MEGVIEYLPERDVVPADCRRDTAIGGHEGMVAFAPRVVMANHAGRSDSPLGVREPGHPLRASRADQGSAWRDDRESRPRG
jgi:hypothetical protein